jgi:hypothetical protein
MMIEGSGSGSGSRAGSEYIPLISGSGSSTLLFMPHSSSFSSFLFHPSLLPFRLRHNHPLVSCIHLLLLSFPSFLPFSFKPYHFFHSSFLFLFFLSISVIFLFLLPFPFYFSPLLSSFRPIHLSSLFVPFFFFAIFFPFLF